MASTTSFDDELVQLELAERECPRCHRCGEHTIASGRHDGSLWLECVSLGNRKPALARLLGLDFTGGHTRRLVIPAPTAQSMIGRFEG
jgi:hypothetical protein